MPIEQDTNKIFEFIGTKGQLQKLESIMTLVGKQISLRKDNIFTQENFETSVKRNFQKIQEISVFKSIKAIEYADGIFFTDEGKIVGSKTRGEILTGEQVAAFLKLKPNQILTLEKRRKLKALQKEHNHEFYPGMYESKFNDFYQRLRAILEGPRES